MSKTKPGSCPRGAQSIVIGEICGHQIIFKCLFTRLVLYSIVTQYREITQWFGVRRVHRKESDPGAGTYRKKTDQVKVEGGCAKALWSGVRHIGGTERGLQGGEEGHGFQVKLEARL